VTKNKPVLRTAKMILNLLVLTLNIANIVRIKSSISVVKTTPKTKFVKLVV